MRLSTVMAAAFFLSVAVPAFPQEWIQYKSLDDRFTCNFPEQPTVTQTTYTSQFGAALPARVYTATQGQSRYSLTVVDYSPLEQILGERAKSCPAGDERCNGGMGTSGPGYSGADYIGALLYATWQFTQRDAVLTQLIFNSTYGVYGHQLHLTNRDGSRTLAALYMHDRRLYIVEGTVPEGYPEPALFQTSLAWIDEHGNPLRYDGLYHHAFPSPPRGRAPAN
ncbi:MAG: hypothetical protein HYU37_07120 [Acidobacteria bacterium]|nr:hypothetical protein [Acidobacteriota bacterium]